MMEMGWAQAVEVFEKQDKYVVKAELRGIKEDDMDVSVKGDTRTIKGEKKSESEVKEEDYYRQVRDFPLGIRQPSRPGTMPFYDYPTHRPTTRLPN